MRARNCIIGLIVSLAPMAALAKRGNRDRRYGTLTQSAGNLAIFDINLGDSNVSPSWRLLLLEVYPGR